ncbi:MAG: SMC-Scp complex subunit ScpB [Clostridia bacterium]|nr:SMC-Scp complex subunit ScpB [Clostridia bacterium]
MNNLMSTIEAIVFASGKGITKAEILEKLDVTKKRLDAIVEDLKEKYAPEKGGIVFIQNNDTLRFVTAPDVGETVAEVLKPLKERELSRSLLEVMAIVAYKQPVTRLEIDDIRSASSDYAISMLLKANLIAVVGRKDAIGRPLLYGTTEDFLVKFQLKDLSELPSVKEVQERIKVLDEGLQKSLELFPEKAVNEVDAPMLAVGEEIKFEKPSEEEVEVDLSGVEIEVAADQE